MRFGKVSKKGRLKPFKRPYIFLYIVISNSSELSLHIVGGMASLPYSLNQLDNQGRMDMAGMIYRL